MYKQNTNLINIRYFGLIGLFLLLAALMVTNSPVEAQSGATCRGVAEIGLVIDRSGSTQGIGNAVRNFAVAFANSFSVSDSEVRFTVTAFDSSTLANLPLTGNLGQITGTINALPIGGLTTISTGINPAYANLVAGRATVPRVMIILSDGGNNAGLSSDLTSAVDTVRAAGIPIFAVAYSTPDTNTSVLGYMDPGYRLYAVNELAGVVGSIVRLVCDSVGGDVTVTDSGPCSPDDGRINYCDAGASIAVYPVNGGFQIYQLDPADGDGSLQLIITEDELNSVSNTPTNNTLIKEAGRIRLYRLTSGEFQVMAPSIQGEKTYILIFDYDGGDRQPYTSYEE